MSAGKVSPVRIRTKAEVSDALALDWFPLAHNGNRAGFSHAIGARDPKTVGRAISGEGLPEAHIVLNSLAVDPAALFNVMTLFGGVFVPVSAGSSDDMALICQMMKAASEYLERMQDGHRSHVDTAALAKLFRPLVPAMLAIIQEANGQAKPALKVVAERA